MKNFISYQNRRICYGQTFQWKNIFLFKSVLKSLIWLFAGEEARIAVTQFADKTTRVQAKNIITPWMEVWRKTYNFCTRKWNSKEKRRYGNFCREHFLNKKYEMLLNGRLYKMIELQFSCFFSLTMIRMGIHRHSSVHFRIFFHIVFAYVFECKWYRICNQLKGGICIILLSIVNITFPYNTYFLLAVVPFIISGTYHRDFFWVSICLTIFYNATYHIWSSQNKSCVYSYNIINS